MIRASTERRSTSVSAVSMAIPGETCWRTTSQNARESDRQLSGWRCQRRARTTSPSRTITGSSQPLTSSTQTSRHSPLNLQDLSLTPQWATLRRPSTIRHAVTAILWCDVMARPKSQSNTEALMQQNTFCKHCRRKSQRPWEWLERIGGHTTPPPYVMFVTNLSRATLCATTATSQGGSEVQHTMPATSSCGWTPKPPPSRWSSTTCEDTTATCWCRPSQRSRARWAASPTIQRSTSASPSGSSASSTAPNSCWPH